MSNSLGQALTFGTIGKEELELLQIRSVSEANSLQFDLTLERKRL